MEHPMDSWKLENKLLQSFIDYCLVYNNNNNVIYDKFKLSIISLIMARQTTWPLDPKTELHVLIWPNGLKCLSAAPSYSLIFGECEVSVLVNCVWDAGC